MNHQWRAGESRPLPNLFLRREVLQQTTTRPGWFTVLIVAAGAALALVIIALLTSSENGDPLGTLAIPAPGDTVAATLADGDPVFVTHSPDGEIAVVEAISTHIASDPMAWCPSSRTIDGVDHGARWDPSGRYLAGPGRTDLGTYEFVVSDDGNSLEVTKYSPPDGRSFESSGVAGPSCETGGYELHPYHAAVDG